MFVFGIHREGSEDVGKQDDPVGPVVPPRLQGNFRGNLGYLGPLPEGRILSIKRNEHRFRRGATEWPRKEEGCNRMAHGHEGGESHLKKEWCGPNSGGVYCTVV